MLRHAQKLAVISVAGLMLAACSSTKTPAPAAPAAPPAATVSPLALPAVGDGGHIAVALRSGDGASIFTMGADGSGSKQLTDGKNFDACPDIAAGDALIAFCSNRTGHFEIWLMDGTGGQQRQLSTLGGDSTFPDISPDGKKVLFCGSAGSPDYHDIYMVNVDGTGLVQLTNSPTNDDCDPVWSPDGSKVLFDTDTSGTRELWVMDPTGQNAKQLTTGKSAGFEPPDWSLDGRIAFIANDTVWVMKADGSAPQQLTQGPGKDYAPAWSPKGNEIVYRHLDSSNNGSLRIVSVASGQSRSVPTGTGTPLAPSWQS